MVDNDINAGEIRSRTRRGMGIGTLDSLFGYRSGRYGTEEEVVPLLPSGFYVMR